MRNTWDHFQVRDRRGWCRRWWSPSGHFEPPSSSSWDHFLENKIFIVQFSYNIAYPQKIQPMSHWRHSKPWDKDAPFYRTQVSWSDLCVWLSETDWVSHLRFWNFTDEDTNSILTDKVNRTIQGNQCSNAIVTNASGAIWWPNLELMQVAPSGDQIWN